MRRRKRSCTFNSQHSQTFQYLRAKINQWIPKELLKVLQNSKQNPNHQHQQNGTRATGTLFCVFTSLIPPFPTELPWGSTWSTGEEQVPTVIQVQQGHPAFLVGANSGGGTKPGAEGAHAAQGRQLNTPLQRKVMLPSSTTHPSPFGEHVCSPAVSFLFKQLVSVGSWGKKIILLWARQDAQDHSPSPSLSPFSHRWVTSAGMGTAAVFWEAHTGLKPSFFQVVFQLQEQSVPFSTHMAEQFSCHTLSAAVLSLPPQKHLRPSAPWWKWFWGMSLILQWKPCPGVLEQQQSRKDTTIKVPLLLTASLKYQSYFTSQFHKGTAVNPWKLQGIWDHKNGKDKKIKRYPGSFQHS